MRPLARVVPRAPRNVPTRVAEPETRPGARACQQVQINGNDFLHRFEATGAATDGCDLCPKCFGGGGMSPISGSVPRMTGRLRARRWTGRNRTVKQLRALVLVVALLAFGAVTANAASASPSGNSTSITLVCDKNAVSSATLTLQRSANDVSWLLDVTIHCGSTFPTRNRVSIPTGVDSAGYVTISSWTVTGAPDNCAGAGPITYKATCPRDGSLGADITIR